MDTKRFHNPEYKRQINANRTYRRAADPRPEGRLVKFLHRVGLKNPVRQFFALLVFLFLVYLGFFAKFLRVENLQIKGATPEEQNQIQNIFDEYRQKNLYFILPQKNTLFFNEGAFAEYLMNRDYQISSITSIKKSFFNNIEIEIKQRVPAFVLQAGNGTFILNSDGAISEQIQDNPDILLNRIILTDGSSVSQGHIILDNSKNSFLTYLNDNFKNKTGLEIKNYDLANKDTDQIVLVTKSNFSIYFNFNTSPEEYLNKFWMIWSSLTPEQQQKLFYADMRFNQNAYFCYRGDGCAQ